MAVLKYITKGNRSPQGVPRVYFCCHPDEQSLFLEPVAKLLLEKQSCAVFYLEDPAGERDADFWADLKQVQLFVMPVTTRLLTTENPAMEEFRFAVENHIPVLPLMQESGLDKIFAEKCGDLQYLNPNARDDTALSFDEKLSKYLQNVLIGDELAEKIRAAFDAYVFLSYRKKDRRYAQELMRLIHKNDFCRDIAIWYDEFLIPGENFNDSIRKALEKSGLLVLAVTPNLVNEVNYVMTTEYYIAETTGKPVLPVEMVKTDGAALEKHYPNIPAVTDVHDEEAFTAALLEKVKGLAILENDTSPEHNFFIGLAYLGGVDVETDHERALALITGAAEAGLPEAMEKLVSMYREGLGVARNYQTAIAWQRRVAEYYRNAYETEQTEKAGYCYLSALWDLGDYIYETHQIPAAGAVYTEMLRFCGNLQDTYGTNNRIRRYLSVAYNKVGDIYRAMGQLSEALSRYEASLELAKQLAEETRTIESEDDLAVSHCKMGNVTRGAERQSHYREAYRIWDDLARRYPENPEYARRRDMVKKYLN